MSKGIDSGPAAGTAAAGAVAAATAGAATVAVDGRPGGAGVAAAGLSPGALALRRFRRDRVGMFSLGVVLFFLLVSFGAPLIARLYGKDPNTHYGQRIPGLLTPTGAPVLPNGGVSGEFWFGLEPGLGRDVFTQLLYGMRTSLVIAFAAVLLTTVIGMVVGVTVGYLSGLSDRLFVLVSNTLLAFPTLLLFIAMTPVIDSRLVEPGEEKSALVQFGTLILVLAAFGWVTLALLLRTLVRSLREREFVQAARAMGASRTRIIFRELLPNLWAPIIIHVTLAVPAYVTTEAALSFLGVGILEPIPDWGRMINRGAQLFYSVPTYMFWPGVTILVFVLAFNLLGDAVRDALDPRTGR
ncbi:ABC transporter permease [Allostreptomyces psammosilenae]|uniref:Peptide/nickel transport system permease protein n=1 Tax=Allostreptomyces psammosilenae TaxID=1892865 RepID=A0A852ZW60_9ACTN|nr:ABC transporter permease [Allostreptomyces psammosilenae]NYI05004.1 peptide/nickel transport system permease protein [Allostreptomyces psammosilenae]